MILLQRTGLSLCQFIKLNKIKKLIYLVFFWMNCVNAQHPWFNNCEVNFFKNPEFSNLFEIVHKDSLKEFEKRLIHRKIDSIVNYSCSYWYYDFIKYRDTAFFRDFNTVAKPYRDSGHKVFPNLSYTPSQLSQSRIANLPMGDSMTFYYFTWYTIKADWEAAVAKGTHVSFCATKKDDADVNGDLPDGLWQWYDSMGYKRVYMLRKLILKRTPCKWIVHASKDIFFTPDNVQWALDSFTLMIKDGKERFKFEHETTFARCFTSDELIEWNYPVDFYYPNKRQAHLISGSRYMHNWIWKYAKIELNDKQATKAVLYHKGKNKANRNYLTNNMLITFSDGTRKSYYLPFWFYLRKNYIRQWTPPNN